MKAVTPVRATGGLKRRREAQSTVLLTEPGSLKRRVKAKKYKSKARVPEAAYVITAPYGHLVERGHRGGAAPHPFFLPTIRANLDNIGRAVGKEFNRRVVRQVQAFANRFGRK